MASSSGPKPMEDEAFSERVKKTFGSLLGSLQPSPSPVSLSNPLWSLSGADVQKKEWRRDKDTSARDSTPCSSSFDDLLSPSRKKLRHHRNQLDDDAGDEDQNDVVDGGIVDWDVRSTIGLDPTLDNEEEEDTFDKVAIGRENAGDRLYMRDVIDNHDVDFKSKDDNPGVIGNRQRDPRANLWAAKIRLNEDDVEAAAQTDQPKPDQQAPPPPPQAAEKKSSTTGDEGDKLKPILKRKEHETSQTTTKASKRVRFDPECLSASATNVGDITPSGIRVTKDNNGSRADEKVSRVPDYIQNPSKYTRYSFDSVDEISDKSNSGAFFDFLEMVKKAKSGGMGSEETDAPLMELPKSVTFVPKKKSDIADKSDGGQSETSQDRQSDAKSFSIQPNLLVLAAEEDRETGVGDMDVDEPEGTAEGDDGTTIKKQGRQYRSKSRTDEEEEA